MHNAFKFIPVALLVLGCHAPSAVAQTTPGMAERLHAHAVASFRQARFPEAYGRFSALADAGHAPSAEMALWMFKNATTVFGSDWDSTQEQLSAWAQLARQPVPVMVARHHPQTVSAVSTRKH